MMTNHTTAVRAGSCGAVAAAVRRALGSATFLAITSLAAGTALAQEQQPARQGGEVLQEVTVTGSRIARTDGYEAPTPVSVLGAEQLNAMATTTIADSVNRLPTFANSQTTRNMSSNISSGTAGVNVLNLRGLGGNRTLVLQDGKRMVGSSLGTGGNASAVDVNAIPSGLVQRVEVVTGGASAVYGSDALAGVVNFILDKEFTGIKANVEGGVTQAGDGENWKVGLTAGTPFADGRGHLLFSGEVTDDRGIIGNDRSWADDSFLIMSNPNYPAASGEPQYLTVHNAALAAGTVGGLILSGPLRGTQFGQDGAPTKFNFGELVSGPIMSGGDWQAARIDRSTTIALPLQRRSLFGRGSFNFTDNVTGFLELQYSKTKSHNKQVVHNLNPGGVVIHRDNPFIPASVQQAMDNAGIENFMMGTMNGDMPFLQGINERELKRGVVGLEGNFDMMGTEWTWDTYYAHSEQEITSWTPGNRINANYAKALNAVIDPLTGQIACGARDSDTNLVTIDPTCVPYNPMGLGVNTSGAISYVAGMGYADTVLKQQVVAASMSGEPFSTWAGPVSIALGAEHRRESVDGVASALDEASAFFAGNYHATQGKYNVTEGFLETVVPLLKDVPLAQALDFNGAVRYTDYSTSGNVTTWKLGATWTPIDDIRFRLTRSRDIRAANLGEMFNKGQSGTGSTFDPVLNEEYFMLFRTVGNPNLKPEEADTTGLGVVLSPRFIPGFTVSVDYYKIEIDGAITTVSDVLNRCAAGDARLCSFVTRDPVTNRVTVISPQPANVLGQTASGVDVDASYNLPLPVGDLQLRAMASFVSKLETTDVTTIDGRGVNSDDGGVDLGTGLFAPKYRYLVSAGYNLDPVTVTLSMRGVSSGVYNNAFIECASNCPTQTEAEAALNPTINNNHIESKQYFDLAVNYKIGLGDVFVVVENLLNEDPASVAGGTGGGFYQGMSNVDNYDRFGRMFRTGVRFQF